MRKVALFSLSCATLMLGAVLASGVKQGPPNPYTDDGLPAKVVQGPPNPYTDDGLPQLRVQGPPNPYTDDGLPVG